MIMDNSKSDKRKMGHWCSVPGCKFDRQSSLHRFPKNLALRKKWAIACRIGKPITSNMCVCSAHFRRDDYMPRLNPKHPRLRKNEDIVPSLNLPKRPLDKVLTDKQQKEMVNREQRLLVRQTAKDNSLHFNREDYSTELNSRRPQLKKTAIPSRNVQSIKEKFIPNDEVKARVPIAQPLKKDLISKWKEESSQKDINTPDSNTTDTKVPLAKRKNEVQSNALKIGPKSKISKTEGVNIVTGLYIKDPTKLKIGSNSTVQQTTLKEMQSDTLSKTQLNEDAKEHQQKVTTIIYLPSNCKKIVDEKSGNIKIDLTNNSTVKKVILGDDKNIDQKISDIQQNVGTKTQTNIIFKSVSVSSATAQENSETQKQKTVDISANQLVNKQVDIKKANNKKINIKSVSAIILCTGCGQYCKIADEDLINVNKKNIETLAAETLLELQKVDLTNESEHILLTRKGIEICDKALQMQKINLMDMISSDDELQAFTGVTFDLLDTLTNLVVAAKDENEEQSTFIREKIVMCLCKLKTNLPFRCIAVLFGVSQQVCTSDIFTMIRELSKILERTIYWLKTDELLKALPKRFHSFKQTRVMLVCNSSQTEKLKCSKCKNLPNLVQNDNDSIKYILGIAPTGLIVFKSNLFDSKLTDDAMITKAKFMDRIDADREAIIAHESLDLESECLQRKVTLIKVPKSKNIFDRRDVEIIKSISSARLHVDRTLQRYKTFKILQSTLSWDVLPFVDNISTIIAGIVNLRNPTPPDKKRLEI